MVNFYRKFIPQCAKILAPLNFLLQGIPAGRNANLSWNEEASTAFEDIKVALSNATLLFLIFFFSIFSYVVFVFFLFVFFY